MNRKAAVGLSGGVDSAVAAAVLVDQDYDVTAVFLECWKEPGCRTDADRKDALSVALKLKIPFKVLDFKQEYRRKVVDHFYDEYKAGRTPNPDVMCNKEIKFGLFYDWCLENGFDYMATGHYAKIICTQKPVHPDFFRTDSSPTPAVGDYLYSRPAGPRLAGDQAQQGCEKYFKNGAGCLLCIPKDKHKDQTYFLYRLKPEQLEHILFPLGGTTKVEVRQEARKRGLSVADKPDSQGICFIGEVNISQFLRERLPVKQGEVVDTRGQVIGEHDGVWFYTIGQRHGFRVGGGGPPLYVIAKDVENNRLVVGFGAETYRNQFEVSDLNWLANGIWHMANRPIKVRIRHGGALIPAKLKIGNPSTSLGMVSLSNHCKLKIRLEEPQRGIASGQSAVLYDGDVVLGGGIID